MTIPIYITRPLVKQWISANEPELKFFVNFIYFQSFDSFLEHIKKNTITNVSSRLSQNIIVAVDVSGSYEEIFDRIHHIDNNLKIIIFDLITDTSKLLDILRCGYNSVVEVGTKAHDVIAIIQKLLKQEISICPDLTHKLLLEHFFKKNNHQNNHDSSVFDRRKILKNILSEKQQIVFDNLLLGKTYKEISQLLGVSFYVVNQRAKTIYRKLGVRSRVELLNLVMN